ncbi:MAG TPA: alanine--tRNA ligase [Saprospiraceae bacterium]|nr:alanine--tRNA ligase [Saprospiraceae bacterium]
MMTAREIRKTFLDFFASKGHKIVPSAPIVNREDPTLMFTNAGMNQFKDFFLGNQTPDNPRIADTQKCMRVSGKHNDLEDVGYDGTHHTMFEMLGNWSIGDYFKDEAIAWSWELLHDVFGIPKDRLYATVFGGDEKEKLDRDDEALQLWLRFLPREQILYGNKKDNFWEMGDTGPCGPCSEIHVDLRSDTERALVPGHELVNQDHPQVVEIWNNVFIQFNRKADGSLEQLPAKHVDTGMGFERLAMVLQGKRYTYDTDIFTPVIRFVEHVSGIQYAGSYERSAKTDIAMRVIADHIRSVAFTIADGQLPGSGGAGYVVRRILRRAVRYYYSFLGIQRPLMHQLIPIIADWYDDIFPELKAQQDQIARIIEGEENAFLHTLENGIRRFESLETTGNTVRGKDAFDLLDTYGFPIDLTRLMAQEKGLTVDEEGFTKALEEQKQRARADAQKEVGDWVTLSDDASVTFVGYDALSVEQARIVKHRTVKVKGKDQYQLVLNVTPFYAESGGQAGDTGVLTVGAEKIQVIDTQKENDLIIHVVNRLPADPKAVFHAQVDAEKRRAVSSNHSATHLMHAALHEVLGNHALQKGQDVTPDRLRFDFSHFQKVSDEEIKAIEAMVNAKIRENIALEEDRAVPIEEAKKLGAMMLFGEKYGEFVRVITFDKNFSRELCGGTHVAATGQIGQFKIVAESAVAAGIRRIEAVTAGGAEAYFAKEMAELNAVRETLKNPQNLLAAVQSLQEENRRLGKEIERLVAEQAGALKGELMAKAEQSGDIRFISAVLPLNDANAIKTLAYQLEKELGNAVVVLGAMVNEKPLLTVIISQNLVDTKGLHAGNMVRELAKEIQGGGGGQPFFATAGGKDANGLEKAVQKAKTMLPA